jgi:hypothetical protein
LTLFYLSLNPLQIDYTGKPDVDEYWVLNQTLTPTNICGANHIVAEISFNRSLLGFFLTVCLPTIMANLIGHLTNYFGEEKFDAAIGVNLTLLLVITTMYVYNKRNYLRSIPRSVVDIVHCYMATLVVTGQSKCYKIYQTNKNLFLA